MAEFGPNGAVLRAFTTPERNYASAATERPRIRRVVLACFLCGVCACISVALIALFTGFIYSSLISLAGLSPTQPYAQEGFLNGAMIAVMVAGFNWIVFYIVIPITWLILFFSIGRFPRRGIVRHRPYYRWGVIWGAILVAGPAALFAALGEVGGAAVGGAITSGALIGAIAGLICASLFLAIVRPQQQVQQIEMDVF